MATQNINFFDPKNIDGRLKIVQTIDGSYEYAKNCYRDKYDGAYYRLHDQCIVNEDGTKTIKSNAVKDHETNQMVDKRNTKNLTYGIISFEENKPIYGYFTKNRTKNINIYVKEERTSVIAISEDILPEGLYFESFPDEMFLLKSEYCDSDIKAKTNKKIVMNKYKNSHHEIEQNQKQYDSTSNCYNSNDLPQDSKCERLLPFIKNYRWGIEQEFSSGYISDRFLNKYGWVMCRDGSTSSETEAVSIPYQGLKGLVATKHSFEYFNKQLLVDDSCSLHIHLSGFPQTKEFVVAIWKLGTMIQEELFLLFNHSKQDYTLKNKNNNKNYNRFLEKLFNDYNEKKVPYDSFIDTAYYDIFGYLSQDNGGNRVKANRDSGYIVGYPHPVNQKWQRPNRYLWLNLSNIFFSRRGTVEFRPHTPTSNPTKVMSWLFICTSILEYCKKNCMKILKGNEIITLSNIVSIFEENNPENVEAVWLSNYLRAYIKQRKNEQYQYIREQDFNGKKEIETDNDFSFVFLGESIV